MNIIKQQPSATDVDPGEIHTQLVRDLISLAAGIIGLAPERMEPKVNLGDYGFESMGLKSLAEQISSRFGIAFSPAQFFERASLAGVAEWLFEEYEARIMAYYLTADKTVAASASVPSQIEPAGQDQPINKDHHSTLSREPIAIIGLSGRFPGSRDSIQFWENLRTERDLVGEIPHDRWDWHDYDHDGLLPPERCKFHWGGFIDDADKFDPLFFGISPAEAEMMDPQQRTFLEAVWAAIEDAGYRASELSGKNVGLFAGIQFSDYQHLLHEAGLLTAQSALGNEHSIVLNRISYLLNLRGPSEPVNTACSSSLVAVHRAVRSLRSGESSIAIAGGIALNLSPHSTVAAGRMGLLAPDGKCKTLDRSANGYVKGEGIGVIVLKPLGQALSDGDHIYAVIRGTAVNHGGRAASLTAPNSEAQSALIQAVLEEAEIGSETIGYLELHGTGTELGDPVEINGIKSAFRKIANKRGAPPLQRPHCALGSVKTNIGHLEPASGIAGMIKVILAMQNQTLPGIVHFKELNPYIDLKDSPFFVVEKTRRWERLTDLDHHPLPFRAGISSFGFGGVNAHVLLEECPSSIRPLPVGARDQLFVFSGKTKEALQKIIKEFLCRIEVWEQYNTIPSLDDVAYTLQVGREEMKERLACVADNILDLRKILERLVAEEPCDKPVYRGQAGSKDHAFFTEDMHVLAKHWANGGVVDWTVLQRNRQPHRVSLPTYPFARKRYWFKVPEGSARLRKPDSLPEDREAMAPLKEDDVLSGENSVRSELKEILAEKLKLSEDELDEDTNLQDFGVDSMLGAVILQAIQEKFGSQVPLTAVADYPTLRLLSKYIYDEFFAGQESVSEAPHRRRKGPAERAPLSVSSKPGPKQAKLPPELLPINMKGSQQTSFWVHGAAGYSSWFQNLSEALGPEYPIYAFQARGSDGHSVPQVLEEMVDHYVHCIRLVQPKGPYVIGGYSFGGIVAIEMARRLQAEGETIRHLIMFDTYPSTQDVFDRHFAGHGYEDNFLEFYLANYYLKVHQNPDLAIRPADVAHLPARLQLAELAKICQQRGNKRISADDIYMYLRGGLTCSAHAEGIYQMYKMKPYDGSDVLFFKATDGFTGRSSAMYWKPTNILKDYDYPQEWRESVKRNFREIALDNDHLNMLEEPTLTVACREIEAVLKKPPALDMDQYQRFRGAFAEVTRFGHELLADKLRSSGALPGIHETFSREDLHEKLRVLPQYDRLFHASLDILEREEYTREEGGRMVATPKLQEVLFPGGEADVNARSRLLAVSYPEINDYLPLLTTCQAASLEVMNGSRDSMDVIFPGGSMALVAELYKGNLQTGFYNRLVAERVQEYVRHHVRRYKHSKIQLFEVGAGTGGTSVFVFEALKDQAQKLRYLYTDIGPAFVQMAKRQFAVQYPFVDFITFDVEKPPEAQGFEPETMDVVIASNVLHTTRRIAVTLQQCQRMLKPDGILIINELTQRFDYNTLTFGLTTGWWLYEDDQERIKGTPLLRSADWQKMLENAGFTAVEVQGVPGAKETDQAQCIIVATKRAGFSSVTSQRLADVGVSPVGEDPHVIALSNGAQSQGRGVDLKHEEGIIVTGTRIPPDIVLANQEQGGIVMTNGAKP